VDLIFEFLSCNSCLLSGVISFVTLCLLIVNYRRTLDISKKIECKTVMRQKSTKPPPRRRLR